MLLQRTDIHFDTVHYNSLLLSQLFKILLKLTQDDLLYLIVLVSSHVREASHRQLIVTEYT